jgi:hypothetical protein
MSVIKLKSLAIVAMLIASPAVAAEGDPGTGKAGTSSPASQPTAPKQGAADVQSSAKMSGSDTVSPSNDNNPNGPTKMNAQTK